jgi:soluble lytic murein transglycosylase
MGREAAQRFALAVFRGAAARAPGPGRAARALYAKAAQSAGFHGWLAADRLQRPYALCPLEPVNDPAIGRRVAGNAGLLRALDLFAIDRPDPAGARMGERGQADVDDERRVAVRRAIGEGWYDRAGVRHERHARDSRYYTLRFPLHHESDIRVQSQVKRARPGWVAGQTRAESSFMPRARSGPMRAG